MQAGSSPLPAPRQVARLAAESCEGEKPRNNYEGKNKNKNGGKKKILAPPCCSRPTACGAGLLQLRRDALHPPHVHAGSRGGAAGAGAGRSGARGRRSGAGAGSGAGSGSGAGPRLGGGGASPATRGGAARGGPRRGAVERPPGGPVPVRCPPGRGAGARLPALPGLRGVGGGARGPSRAGLAAGKAPRESPRGPGRAVPAALRLHTGGSCSTCPAPPRCPGTDGTEPSNNGARPSCAP